MKTVYIPKGETVRYESLATEHLVVKGCLQVVNGIQAKTISGGGIVCAGSVSADTICLDELETSYTVCKSLICKRAETTQLFASDRIVASCFLSAAYVETRKLAVAISEIDEVKADEVVNLPAKKRGILGTLLAAALRTFWTKLTVPAAHSGLQAGAGAPASAETVEEPAEVKLAECTTEETTEPCQEPPAPVDEELNRFVNMFNLLRDSGYTLRIIPGTPEENAPVFDFDRGCIVQKAA